MMPARRVQFFFAALIIFVVGALVIANPRLRLYSRAPEARFQPPPRYPLVQGVAKVSPNEARTPAAHLFSRPDHVLAPASVAGFKLKTAWVLKPFNLGIHNASKASPVIDETGIYAGTDAGWFFKVDFDGRKVWSFFTGDADRGIHSTAAVDQEFVYFGSYNGFLYCLRKDDGDLVYARKMGDSIGASVMMSDGFLYLGIETHGQGKSDDGFAAKVRARDGEVMWLSDWLGANTHSTPALDAASKTVVLGSNRDQLVGLDAETGAVKWQMPIGGDIKSAPVVIEGVAYVGAWDRNFYAVQASTGTLVYKKEIKSRITSTLVADPKEGVGYLVAEFETAAIRLKDGEIIWSLPLAREFDMGRSSPALLQDSNGRKALVLMCSFWEVCTADAKTGQTISRINTGFFHTSVPVIYKGRAYLAADSELGLWAWDLTP